LREEESRCSNHLGDSNNKGASNICTTAITGVIANMHRHNLSVAKGYAMKSLTNIPITNANCVIVPNIPRKVGGAISPK